MIKFLLCFVTYMKFSLLPIGYRSYRRNYINTHKVYIRTRTHMHTYYYGGYFRKMRFYL